MATLWTRFAGALLIGVSFCATASAYDKFIPAAAHSPGANNTFFQTDVRVVNLTAQSSTVNVTFLPSNTDNRSALPVPLNLGPRQSRQLDDILGTYFQVTSGAGALRLTSTSAFIATSRTYTGSSGGAACPGTYGQFIPALDVSAARTRNLIANIRLSASSTSGFRSNVNLVNPGAATVVATLTLRDGDGRQLATAPLSVLPLAHTQASVATLFGVQQLTSDNTYVEVSAPSPLIAAASVIENVSADAIFVLAEEDPVAAAPAGLIVARQWVFEPATIEARVGEGVTVRMQSIDIDHGVGFSGVGPVTCSSDQGGQCILRPNEIVTITFTPQNAGTFAFFCTRFCGESTDGQHGHETMRGTLVVR